MSFFLAFRSIALTIEQHEQAADPISSSQGYTFYRNHAMRNTINILIIFSILYPPNPHLRYFYPDPTPDILANISNAIGTIPRFYTQVLHLMNKYNMPPPFGPVDKESIPSLLKRKHDDLLASDESELEEEDNNNAAEIQEQKVKQARLSRIAAEKQKIALTASPAIASNSKPTSNKIKINIGKLTDGKQKSTSQLQDKQKLIRDKCLAMPELINLPAFKNYSSGTPSNKLYIKNLSKQVTQQDLFNLYEKFNKDIQVNLMTKGRLRDQAFVTFPDEKIASLALECTNGYMLFDRPMAVLFGKAAIVNE